MFYSKFVHAQQITFVQAREAAMNTLKYERGDDDLSESTIDTVIIKQQNTHNLIYGVCLIDRYLHKSNSIVMGGSH